MMGCLVWWKCFVACLFFESSQQPTWPHVRHSRRCTHVSPIARHSSQPVLFGSSVRTKFRWSHSAGIARSSQRTLPGVSATPGHMLVNQCDGGGAFTDRTAHPLDRSRAHVADG